MGFFLIEAAYFLFAFYSELSMHYIAVILLGIGIGIQFNPIIRNVWIYLPESKSFITIIYLLVFGFSSVLITIFFEYVYFLNSQKDGIPILTVSEKRQYCFKITIITSISVGIFGILLTSNYTNENNTLKEDSTDNINPNILIEKSINDNDIFFNMNYQSQTSTKCSEIISFWQIFFFLTLSFRFWYIVIMYMLSYYFCSYYSHYLRFIGTYNNYDYNTIYMALYTYTISIAISRIAICFFFYCFKFKSLFIFILLCQIVIGIVVINYINETVYLVYTAIAGVCYAGITSLISPLIEKLCGKVHSFQFCGLINAFGSFSSLIVPGVLFYCNKKELVLQYISYSSSCASIVALILCILLDTTPFDYSPFKECNLKLQKWKESSIDLNQSNNFIDKSLIYNNSNKII